MKNKNTIISFLIILVVFVGIVWLAKPSEDKAEKNQNANNTASVSDSGTPTLEVAEKFYNFGEISMKQGKVKHEFKVKNTTDSPINIAKVYTSCMCTSATIAVGENKKGPFGMPGHGFVPKADMLIPAGAEAIITAEFDPNAHGPAGVGRIERAIYLEDDAGGQTVLNFEATVTP